MNASPPLNAPKTGRNGSVVEWVAQVRLGTPQTYREIVVWPLFLDGDNGAPYRTLDEAVDAKQAWVTEVSQGGSVPELKVVNESPDLLLILDGEELVGAKQNRVVNATLLLKPKSETMIPVSCTEQGRWRHVSKAVSSSEVVMEMKLRRSKMRSVSDSLKATTGHSSDQGKVWSEILALHQKAGHISPTQAMHDLFAEREKTLKAALATFTASPGQHGLVVTLRGEVAGCDLLSRSDAYSRLHGKLIRSYVLDSLLEKPGVAKADETQVWEFLAGVSKCREERFPSVGCGESVRLQNGTVAGGALVYERMPIHAALFRFDPGEERLANAERMAGLARRRRWF